MKLLLIEDNDDQRETMCLTLRGKWEVITAKDGSDALICIAQSVKDQMFDVMVVDIAMEWIDGISFVRLLDCLEKYKIYPHPRILIHTAHDDLAKFEILERLGISRDQVFVKTLDTDKLIETLTGAKAE